MTYAWMLWAALLLLAGAGLGWHVDAWFENHRRRDIWCALACAGSLFALTVGFVVSLP